MIVYYTPPAITAQAPVTAPTVTTLSENLTVPAVPAAHVQVKPPYHPAVKLGSKQKTQPDLKTAEHVTAKGQPSQSWLQASGFPSGVLAADNQWQPNKWVAGGKAPLTVAVKTITGLPVSLGVGVAGNTKVHWRMQSRLTCLYTVARQVGVIIQVMPHTVRIISG